MGNDAAAAETSQIRHSLVEMAVNFLLNPAVIDKQYHHKTAFLKKKGLTDSEIALAHEKAEKDSRYKEFQANGAPIQPVLPPPVPYRSRPVSLWYRLSSVSSSLIVVGVALFGVQYVYKNYIEPYIFGRDSKSDKSKKVEEHLMEVANSISQIDKNIAALEEKINTQKIQMDRFLVNEVNEYCPTPLALRELKVEIAAVKSILLNRHQFPALPKVSPASIPEWQLPAKESTCDTNQENGKSKHSTHESKTQVSADDNHLSMQNGENNEVTEDSKLTVDQNELSDEINNLSTIG